MPSDHLTAIPLSTPNISGNEWLYIKECLDSGWVSSVGAYVDKFEREFAAYIGAKHAVATTCGTAAIHIALLLAGVEPGDEVLMPTLTFIAPANAVRYVGAFPVFVDADPVYWQIDVSKLRHFIVSNAERTDRGLFNRRSGRRIKALLPVHILGHPVDYDDLAALAAEYALPIIEDATESLGSMYRSKKTGSLGLAGCFSFNGNKIITTGGGGMITTNDDSLATRARYLTTQAKDNPVEFIHGEIGYNYRLTNVQAAMGCAQLEQLPDFIAHKRQIAGRYSEAIKFIPGITPPAEAPWAASNLWLYTVRIDANVYGQSSRDVMRRLSQAGIQARPFWQPMHLSPVHRDCQATPCDVATRLWEECLSLPCSTHLKCEEQDRVIAVLGSAFPK